jgi:hypothetical protein
MPDIDNKASTTSRSPTSYHRIYQINTMMQDVLTLFRIAPLNGPPMMTGSEGTRIATRSDPVATPLHIHPTTFRTAVSTSKPVEFLCPSNTHPH